MKAKINDENVTRRFNEFMNDWLEGKCSNEFILGAFCLYCSTGLVDHDKFFEISAMLES